MPREPFDSLRVVSREFECRSGCAEVCRDADGTRRIRLRLVSEACQTELLGALDSGIPVRLEQGVLELLLPWHSGVSLDQWLYERRPGLGQRRDACLSLLRQQIESHLPPCLTVLSARTENLLFTEHGACLQYLAAPGRWESGLGQPQAVRAAAGLICEILTRDMDDRQRRCFPEELRLLLQRTREEGYTDWGQLQRDVAALPDELPRLGIPGRAAARRVAVWLRKHGRAAATAVAALLFVAALLSLAAAYRVWSNGRRNTWPGMPTVGTQSLK